MKFILERWLEGLMLLGFGIYLVIKYSLQIRNFFGISHDFRLRKKTDLEIEKLNREAKEEESVISKPTAQEVRRFDPKWEQLESKIKKMPRVSLPPVVLILAIVMSIYLMLGQPASFRGPVLFGVLLVALAILIDLYISRKQSS